MSDNIAEINRKLSVFKEIRSNLWVKSGIIRDAEFDDVISFDIHSRTSGLNRKLSVFTVYFRGGSNELSFLTNLIFVELSEVH